MPKIELYGDTYDVECRHRYKENQAPVLELFDSETGEIGGVISVCIPEAPLESDETALINLDDQIDLKALLVKSGVVCDCGKQVSSGYGCYEVVKVNMISDI